jgi:hypothetical protein
MRQRGPVRIIDVGDIKEGFKGWTRRDVLLMNAPLRAIETEGLAAVGIDLDHSGMVKPPRRPPSSGEELQRCQTSRHRGYPSTGFQNIYGTG